MLKAFTWPALFTALGTIVYGVYNQDAATAGAGLMALVYLFIPAPEKKEEQSEQKPVA